MPNLSFEYIVKKYGDVTVLDELHLAIEDGDFLVLLGPSGCGKTTLLNLLAGLTDLTSGRIMVGERDVSDLDPKDRGLAMVFQSYALYPTKTVQGNLRFGLSARNLPQDEVERRIQWAAELLQLGALMGRKPGQLSGGQRQRVAIGRALVKHAEVLLFDEPLSNLDAKLRTEMRMEIKKLHDQLNPTVVYVTHDQIEAMTMATKIAVMNGGEIQQFGTPDEVYEKPANLFVAGFIGSPQMTIVDSTVVAGDRGISAEFTTGERIDLSGYDFNLPPKPGSIVKIGLRPEHFSAPNEMEADPACTLSLPVDVVERTGSDTIVTLAFGDKLMTIRTEPDKAARLTRGDVVSVSYPKNKLNIFDVQSGHRI
ncbi:ABC transporter ATP-binding protein [Qingshengfaniella alkalisoli]|uniref:ABC transporter ATP-binding protein n=1 Tax=Qingshengfaniella alkalisoli TaxID=2599296 RepID=A0A5B8IXU8_9RHOB|nr:ABC transporter ATP-binding protein [Qingshengfaniella alkalisoli]QDY70433.1 ABC transporter ATP-binding protein [Qingshengfaniella alkalisoli]